MNRIEISGRLTRDPEVKMVKDGELKVAHYTLAVRRWRSEETDFIECVAFGSQAQFVEKYLCKGMKIIACGSLLTSSYEKDGKREYRAEVVVEEHEFCEKKSVAAAPYRQSDEEFEPNSDLRRRSDSRGGDTSPFLSADGDFGDLPFA